MGTRIKQITIVGGGLAGCLLANMLSRRGYDIHLYEARQDPRSIDINEHRSINLAISARGLHALDKVNLKAAALQYATAMRGRYIHQPDEEPMAQTYGVDETQVIHAIERSHLHRVLVDALDQCPNVICDFNVKIEDWDPNTGALTLTNQEGQTKTISTDLVIGADGVNSKIRRIMIEKSDLKFKDEIMSHGYKELIIPKKNAASLAKEWLHIWPRDSFMLIALPNVDGSFTCTLFLDNKGEVSFESLTTATAVNAFFSQHFPDVALLIPDLAEVFLANPHGTIRAIEGYPWHVLTRGCLIGDAAHAIMPFYGQGMNCAFEDCEVLVDMVDLHKKNWDKAFLNFERQRKPNADAIALMSMQNYIEMRDKVAKPDYQLRREVEHYLMTHYPREYSSEYTMVSFELLPYAFVHACGLLQEKLLDRITGEINSIDDLPSVPHLDDRIHGYARALMDLKMTFM